MFIAIPLENKPSWRSPPWMTVLLIVINCVIFWGWQAPEEAAVQRAGQRYAQTALPPIELPRFAAYMQEQAGPPSGRRERGLAQAVQALYQHQAYAQLYALMWQEKKFRQLLLDGKIITPADPQYAQWQAARAGFAPGDHVAISLDIAASEFGRAGRYRLDSAHGRITWAVNHFGLSIYRGQITGVEAHHPG